MKWRVLFFELNGDGTETFIKGDVPLSDSSPVRKLSSPHQITGTLTRAVTDLVNPDGSPVLVRWKTTVYVADENDKIWCGGILADFSIDGPTLTLDVAGMTAYPKGQPYDADYTGVQVDPFDIVRLIWGHLQNQPGGNLGLVVDSATSPVKVGQPPRQVEFTATSTIVPERTQAAQAILDRLNSGEQIYEDWTWPGAPPIVTDNNDALLDQYTGNVNNLAVSKAWLQQYIASHGPGSEAVSFSADDRAYHINWWSTGDSAGVIDQLAKDTPFDYLEDHVWNGETVEHYLRLGYPSLGVRKEDLRFVLGENVKVIPGEEYSGDDVVTEVWVFGAGEGRDRVRGVAAIAPKTSLRRVKQVDDKSIENNDRAQERARDILMAYQPDIPGAGVTQLLVSDHSNAEFGTFDVGDEIIYSGAHQWGDVLIWVKIISMTLLPTGQMQLAVVRADTLKQ